MKVMVSVAGTFHAFQLAEQLERYGALHRLFTTHRPLRGEQIGPARIAVNPLPEIAMRAPRTMGLRWRAGDYVKAELFDRWVARALPAGDVLVAFASFCLRSLHRARASGIVTILERGSTHVLSQSALVGEEYRRWGCPEPAVDQRLMDKQLREYEEADYICVPSRFAAKSFLEHRIPQTRLLHIPYGVDLRRFVPGRSPGRPFRILTVGVGLRKGTPYLLDAVASLGIPKVELWLAGAIPGDLVPILAKTPTPFRHLGTLSHAALAAVYRQASVFVLPSIEEGLPLAILEAMASGVPLVVTPNTGAEDIITDGREGFVVPSRDPGALRQNLLRLYEDEDARLAMGEAGAKRARQWTWDGYGERVMAAYRQVLQRSATEGRARPGPIGSRQGNGIPDTRSATTHS